jgi:acylphosphatase
MGRRVVAAENLQRWEILFTGHVQGVGFRYATRRIAQDFAVSGFVKNLSDGRVQVVAEGTRGELTAFVRQIEQAMRDHIDSKTVDVGVPEIRPAAAKGNNQFEIQY